MADSRLGGIATKTVDDAGEALAGVPDAISTDNGYGERRTRFAAGQHVLVVVYSFLVFLFTPLLLTIKNGLAAMLAVHDPNGVLV